MYFYKGCHWPFPHRITGDGYQTLMDRFGLMPKTQYAQQQKWLEEDVEYLIEMYRKNLRFDFMADVLERPIDSIRHKIVFLHRAGILEKREDIRAVLFRKRNEYIKRHFVTRGSKYCARHLGLTTKTVENYAYQMGLRKTA